jgi:hypothetical protein
MEKWKRKTLPLSHRPGYDYEAISSKSVCVTLQGDPVSSFILCTPEYIARWSGRARTPLMCHEHA